MSIFPVPDDAGDEVDSMLTEWQPGDTRPAHDGAYLRQFDEGEGLSWWYEGRWNMDSFFAGPSDIQDAPWCGLPFDFVRDGWPPDTGTADNGEVRS